MKYWVSLLLLLSLQVSAQIGEFLPSQKTISKPFGLPIQVDLDGKIDYFVGDRNLVFAPGLQIGWNSNTVQYSLPELASDFVLKAPSANTGWMEYKHRRYEYGLGLIAILQKTFRLGLSPYKGAKFSLKRLKMDKDYETPNRISIPKNLEDILTWAPGDEGIYQTYGGIQVYGGFDFLLFNAGMVTLGWQNQFILSIQRMKESILLTITEEKLNRRLLTAGILPMNGTITHLDGKQFKASFILSFAEPSHRQLFRDALEGKLINLEKALSPERKRIEWTGHDISSFWGIPGIIAQTKSRGSYHLEDDQQDYYLEVLQNKKSGLLISPVFNQRFVYHNEESILLMWTTDMKKSAPEKLRKHFFEPARAVGFKGFDRELDEKNYGTVIGELGVVITKDDISKFSLLDARDVSQSLKARCEELKLSCARESKARSIISKFTGAMKHEWETRKKNLGILLVREPALLHALMKESRLSKEAYFKFLSDRYQSLEGLTLLSIE
jgi:hypothetical protein